MERQGRSYIGFQNFPGSIFLGVVLAVLLLSVSGWTICINSNYSKQVSLPTCYPYTSSGWSEAYDACGGAPSICPSSIPTGNGSYYVFSGRASCSVNQTNGCSFSQGMCIYDKTCGTKCEADSIACVTAGSSGSFWDSQNCQCRSHCSQCDAFEAACQEVSGRFSGSCLTSGGSTCCQGICDVCSGESMKKLYDMKIKSCCEQSLAPPSFANVCRTQGIGAGCGVQWSKYEEISSGEWACQSPGLSVDAANRFRELCFGESSSSMAESSSSGGGSSSGEGSSSSGPSPYPEGCLECPWLDSILDTLTAQKKKVEDIEMCLKYPALCSADGEQIQIDTSILPYIRPFMDSTLKLDSNQLKALRDLDTNLLKMLANDTSLFKIDSAMLKMDSAMLKMDSVKLQSDSATRKTIMGGVSTLDSTIDASSDSTKKWMKRLVDSSTVHSDSNMKYLKAVADSIGITADSLKAHLDSIMNRIPSDILDSILKYQKENAEKEDSVVIGSLDQLDSILDSTIVYWKKAQSADSARDAERNDSTEAIHKAIEDISGSISEILGYGDTATNDMRGDIKGAGDAVGVLRDSALKYWRQSQSADSAYRVQFGGAMETINGTVSGMVVHQDTTNARLGQIGDKIGALLDSTSKYLGGGGVVDSSGIRGRWGDSVAKYNVSEGDYQRLYDSTETAWGVASMDSTWDSSYAYGRCTGNDCPPCIDDSCTGTFSPNRMLQASDSMIAASGVGDALNESVRRQRDSLPTQWDSIYKELKEISFFKTFDSTFLAGIGAKIPNTNSCPEDCFKQDINGRYAFTDYNINLDWKLCHPVAPGYLNSLNAFDIIKLLARILTVVTCLSIITWEVSSRRGGIGL